MKKLVTFTIGLMLTIGDNNSCYASNPVNMGKFPMTMFEEITSKVNSETAQPTQLHFFWTTGRKADETPNNKSPIKIGGSDNLSKLFFARLEDLLSSSKKNLQNKITARIVVDDLTFNSNKDILERLLNDYNDVFSIMYIDAFKKKLQERLPSDIWKDRASVVFANATGGNPAIASDIYRLIHPIILDENDERITKNNYHLTYMDIDTFSLFEYPGMDSLLLNLLNGDHIKESNSTNNNNSENVFKMANYRNNTNDIINIDINNDFDNFKNYVVDILKAINIKGVEKYNLRYFYIIHGKINQLAMNIKETALQNWENGTQVIVNLTGPQFVSKYFKEKTHIQMHILKYSKLSKTTCTLAWSNCIHDKLKFTPPSLQEMLELSYILRHLNTKTNCEVNHKRYQALLKSFLNEEGQIEFSEHNFNKLKEEMNNNNKEILELMYRYQADTKENNNIRKYLTCYMALSDFNENYNINNKNFILRDVILSFFHKDISNKISNFNNQFKLLIFNIDVLLQAKKILGENDPNVKELRNTLSKNNPLNSDFILRFIKEVDILIRHNQENDCTKMIDKSTTTQNTTTNDGFVETNTTIYFGTPGCRYLIDTTEILRELGIPCNIKTKKSQGYQHKLFMRVEESQ